MRSRPARALRHVAVVVVRGGAQVEEQEIDAALGECARQQRGRQPPEGLRLAVARVHAARSQRSLQLAQVEAAAAR
jgi:hypothetical protein